MLWSVASLLRISIGWPACTPNTCGRYWQPFWSRTSAAVGTGNFMVPRPSFTYTNTFCSEPSPATITVSVFRSGFMQRGSEDIEIGCEAGGVPMNVTLPVTSPAVAGSTGLTTGAAGAGADFSPPPQAAATSAATKAVETRMRITVNYLACGGCLQAARPGGRPPPRLPCRSRRRSACRLDLPQHAVLEPLLAPPVHRRHLLPAHEHREVEMVAPGQPGHPAAADHLPFFDLVAHL